MAGGYSSSERGRVDSAGPPFSSGVLLGIAVIVGGLYVSREVLVPFVVAVLLSFILAIPVRKLQAAGLGRVFPVALVVLVAFSLILAIVVVLAGQVTELAAELPRYQSTVRDKVASLKGSAAGSGLLGRLADMVQGLSEEITGKAPGPSSPVQPGQASVQHPMPVEIINTRTSPLAAISALISPILHPLATVGLVAVFTVFTLLQRSDLRNRAIRLAGSRDLHRTTDAMNDAATRLGKLFLAQVLLNAGFGLVVGAGLWAIGVPSPALWGILAAVSRFIPYVGVVLAAGGPIILAAAVDPNWSTLVYTAIFFICAELFVAQIVEPLVYGHSTGLSPLAVIASVTFWGWLWGPVGLILATPLTVCLVVLGRHVDQLEFLDVMLGDRPPLTAAEAFYQRVLAGDAAEVVEQAEVFLRDHSLATYYDEIAVKGLALAQVDLSRGVLDPGRLDRIAETMTEVVEDLADHETVAAPEGDGKKTEVKRAAGDEELDQSLDQADQALASLPVVEPGHLSPAWTKDGAVLCLAGRNELDRCGALMLGQVLGKHGLATRIEGADALTSAGIMRIDPTATRIVCISYLDTSAPAQVRFAVRRIRRRLPQAKILVASWGLGPDDAKNLCELARSSACASRLIEAVQFCLDEATASSAPASAPPLNPAPAEPLVGHVVPPVAA